MKRKISAIQDISTASNAPATKKQKNFQTVLVMPDDLWCLTFAFAPLHDILNSFSTVCRKWYHLVSNAVDIATCWKKVTLSKKPNKHVLERAKYVQELFLNYSVQFNHYCDQFCNLKKIVLCHVEHQGVFEHLIAKAHSLEHVCVYSCQYVILEESIEAKWKILELDDCCRSSRLLFACKNYIRELSVHAKRLTRLLQDFQGCLFPALEKIIIQGAFDLNDTPFLHSLTPIPSNVRLHYEASEIYPLCHSVYKYVDFTSETQQFDVSLWDIELVALRLPNVYLELHFLNQSRFYTNLTEITVGWIEPYAVYALVILCPNVSHFGAKIIVYQNTTATSLLALFQWDLKKLGVTFGQVQALNELTDEWVDASPLNPYKRAIHATISSGIIDDPNVLQPFLMHVGNRATNICISEATSIVEIMLARYCCQLHTLELHCSSSSIVRKLLNDNLLINLALVSEDYFELPSSLQVLDFIPERQLQISKLSYMLSFVPHLRKLSIQGTGNDLHNDVLELLSKKCKYLHDITLAPTNITIKKFAQFLPKMKRLKRIVISSFEFVSKQAVCNAIFPYLVEKVNDYLPDPPQFTIVM